MSPGGVTNLMIGKLPYIIMTSSIMRASDYVYAATDHFICLSI